MFKRIFDFIVSISALLLLLPVLISVALLVRVNLGSPITFKQARPGLNGEVFNMLKFRSMTGECDEHGVLLPDHIRLTRFGKFLRASSMDELPGLWNVLVGKMSIVGPRPLLVEYLPLYNSEQAKRHNVKPGITGWAQINGRNTINWQDKFKLDVWYVENQSFFLDMKIILLTVIKVLRRSDINADGEATMTRFTGNE